MRCLLSPTVPPRCNGTGNPLPQCWPPDPTCGPSCPNCGDPTPCSRLHGGKQRTMAKFWAEEWSCTVASHASLDYALHRLGEPDKADEVLEWRDYLSDAGQEEEQG
ncbi:hypothetical protein HaLaN_05487 [Haematococcus lacustris]|uniref:Uncharacterized protein n=1 Tax=Haematococcus lacustris TaxID=44745 RepID=A0A699YTV0_HAELA|nr:hypothetical protein HaLaN_05487 [Haematococcus lacustris]